jgi:hypothetical protein
MRGRRMYWDFLIEQIAYQPGALMENAWRLSSPTETPNQAPSFS